MERVWPSLMKDFHSLRRKPLVESYCCRKQLTQQFVTEPSSASPPQGHLTALNTHFARTDATWCIRVAGNASHFCYSTVASEKVRFCARKCVQIFRIWLASLIGSCRLLLWSFCSASSTTHKVAAQVILNLALFTGVHLATQHQHNCSTQRLF